MKVETPDILTPNDFRKLNKFNRWFYASLVVGAVIFIAVAGFYIYWISQSIEVLTFKKDIFTVTNAKLHPGDYQTVHFDYCKNQDIPEKQIVTWLVGENLEVRLSTVPEVDGTKGTDTPTGCHQVDSPVRIPNADKLVIPGTYYLRFDVTYNVNPLKQNVHQRVTTEDFLVDN